MYWMLELKSLAHIALPTRDNGTILPALLCAVLVLMAGLQFAPPAELELPVSAGRVTAKTLPAREPNRVVADSIILRDPLFSPTRGGGTNEASSAPLDGAKAVGIVRGRGFARVIMQDAAGTPVSINLGNRYKGWRLTQIGRDSVTFSQGKERLAVSLANEPSGSQSYQPRQQMDER